MIPILVVEECGKSGKVHVVTITKKFQPNTVTHTVCLHKHTQGHCGDYQ